MAHGRRLDRKAGDGDRAWHGVRVVRRGEGAIFARLAANDPVQHKELGEFPRARYALFIGDRVTLKYEPKKNESEHALYQR